MIVRDKLHDLVDALPERELQAAERRLETLCSSAGLEDDAADTASDALHR